MFQVSRPRIAKYVTCNKAPEHCSNKKCYELIPLIRVDCHSYIKYIIQVSRPRDAK